MSLCGLLEIWQDCALNSGVVVGNVLVLGDVLAKISATLGKISAILVLDRLASILRHPAVDL